MPHLLPASRVLTAQGPVCIYAYRIDESGGVLSTECYLHGSLTHTGILRPCLNTSVGTDVVEVYRQVHRPGPRSVG